MADTFDRTFDLGIDAASDDVSLALLDQDGAVVAVRTWHVSTTVSRELLEQVAALLAEAGADRRQIGRIAVDVGPGHYGAVRAAVATAQGMSLALDAPLAAVGRLEADAATAGFEDDAAAPTVVAVHDTGRGIAWAAYEADPATAGGAPREVVTPSITSVEDALRLAPRPARWTGEVSDELAARITGGRDAEGRSGDTIATGPAEPRAIAVVRIARARMAFGDPGYVDAVYLRPPSITRPQADSSG